MYPPVCLTSIVIKVFESILRDTMSKYLYDNNLLHQTNMDLFLEGHVVLHAFNDWTLSLDESTDVCLF